MKGLQPLLRAGSARMRIVFRLVVVLAALLSVAWAYGSQSLVGTVAGEVTNGTPGGSIPSDLSVALHIFSGLEETGVYTTTLTPDHAFRFEEVPLDPGQTLVARTVYDGVMYVSEFVTVESDPQETSLSITVYETTDDPGAVAVAQLHVFLERLGERLQIGQYCVLSNRGVRTYVGSARSGSGARTTWGVKLPDEVESLRFDRGELGGRFVVTEDGFADTRAIPPGEAAVEASFSYELPYAEGLRVEQAFDVFVNSAVLVLPGERLGLEGADLSLEGTLETETGPAVSYTAGPLDADEPLSFAVVPRDVTTSGAQGVFPSDRWDGLVIGIAALMVASVAVYWLFRSPAPGPVPSQVRTEVEAIAALDRDFERGQVSEDVYQERRQALKKRVRQRLSGSSW